MYLQHDAKEISEEEALEFIFMATTYYAELLSYSTTNMNEIRRNKDIIDKIIMMDSNNILH